jgi:methionyl-tRNA formyltransferase
MCRSEVLDEVSGVVLSRPPARPRDAGSPTGELHRARRLSRLVSAAAWRLRGVHRRILRRLRFSVSLRREWFHYRRIEDFCLERGIEPHITRDANSAASTAFVRDCRPDVVLMATFHQILRQPLIEVPALAFLNVHCSLLPEYRGPDPIGTALRGGVAYTGVTVHRVDEGVDSGEILAQERIAVGDARTEAQLRPLLSAVAARLVLDCLDRVRSGRLHGGLAG